MPSAPTIERQEEFAQFLERDLNKELLRFTTVGSVDDGKSTLIGRLLYDAKGVYEDQLASVKKSRINRSTGPIDFSLLTDGLRAEREQGITIDVAYRYFSTPKRKFIIADTPGHEQYTRNMATGASTADLAVILIDASKGLLPQTKRHAYIASLLGIPNLLAAVNKMDLVDFSEEHFLRLQEDISSFSQKLGVPVVRCVPISALDGDNVVSRSERMRWYSGPTFLEHLETVTIRCMASINDLRFPIQYVIRPDASFRGFAGQLASGILRPGDVVKALPSGQTVHVQSIVTYDGALEEAAPPQSITVTLEAEIDLSRGDMLVSPHTEPLISSRFAATLVWFDAQPFQTEKSYLAKHTGRHLKAKATRIRHRVNVDSLERQPADQLAMNDIGEVEFETSSALFFDPYERNRITGSFILIDPISNATVGAGMIREDLSRTSFVRPRREQDFEPRRESVSLAERQQRHGHRPAVVVVSQRDTVAKSVERFLFDHGFEALLLKLEVIPQHSLSGICQSLWSAGLVVVFSGEEIQEAGRKALTAIAGDNLFEFTDLPENDELATRQILLKIKALRGSRESSSQRKDELTWPE